MNAKQRRQQHRRALRMADLLSGLLIDLSKESAREDWSAERTRQEMLRQGGILKAEIAKL